MEGSGIGVPAISISEIEKNPALKFKLSVVIPDSMMRSTNIESKPDPVRSMRLSLGVQGIGGQLSRSIAVNT